MGVDKGDEHAPAFRRKLQPPATFARETRWYLRDGACWPLFPYRAGARRGKAWPDPQLLEHRAIPAKFLRVSEENTVKLFDADESVLVGGITVIKLVLNEAG